MRTKKLLAGAMMVLLIALGAFGASTKQSAPERPRDPWVFRCVLDNRPRTVVLALNKDLYVAYDTTKCNLYKAWQGDVKFDGAVYTTVHGPQPTSRGTDFITEPTIEPWMLRQAGKPVAYPIPRWLGYRFIQGQVHLRYAFEVNGETVIVVEVPEARVMGNDIAFERTIRVHGLPENVRLSLTLPVVDSSDAPLRFFVAGRPVHLKPDDKRKAVDLPISSVNDVEIVTYLPTTTNGEQQDDVKEHAE